MKYLYYINLNERGGFYADVRDSNENTVFEIKGHDIFTDGFMDHPEDLDGLYNYLCHMYILIKNKDVLEKGELK